MNRSSPTTFGVKERRAKQKGKAKEVSSTQQRKPLMGREGSEASAAFASANMPGALAPAAAGAATAAGAAAAPAATAPVKRDSTAEVMVASMIGTAIEFYDISFWRRSSA